jgi:hypothetical protein
MSAELYDYGYRYVMAQMTAEKKQKEAEMALCEGRGDSDGWGEASREWAKIDDDMERYHIKAVRAAAQMRGPPPPPEPTPEERHARPWTHMDYNDVLQISNQSRHCRDNPLTWDDPHVQAGYRYALATRDQYRR